LSFSLASQLVHQTVKMFVGAGLGPGISHPSISLACGARDESFVSRTAHVYHCERTASVTVNTPIAALEAYAAQAMRDGRFADAAAALAEAAANNPGQTPAQQKQASADLAASGAAVLSSHTPAGYPLPQMAMMLGAGSFTLTGTIRQIWVGGTAARLGGAGTLTAAATVTGP
jgi:hypothetical protein